MFSEFFRGAAPFIVFFMSCTLAMFCPQAMTIVSFGWILLVTGGLLRAISRHENRKLNGKISSALSLWIICISPAVIVGMIAWWQQ